MEVYLVGGAVRDELLGRPVTERDWVVVGASAEEMIRAGYRQVGRDFPVFLHPETGEEYALARTERKSGPGHTGFVVHADPGVSLEEDLVRRDLTVNAIARADDGSLIDPCSGVQDLHQRVLRHVSAAFSEDPLRVFRVARFAAQLEGFTVAPETAQLMRQMSIAGALAELSAERVWVELHKALCSERPVAFFQVLKDTDSLSPWFAELATVSLEIPDGLTDPVERYAALIGPAGLQCAAELGARIKCPRDADRLARLVAVHMATLAQWQSAQPPQLYRALQASRAFKKDSQLPRLLRVVSAVTQKDPAPLLTAVREIDASVQVSRLQQQGLTGAALGEGLDAARVTMLGEIQRSHADS